MTMIVVDGTKLYSTEELAELLNVSTATITNYRTRGLLPFTRVGRKKYTSEEALKAYLDGKTRSESKNR